MRRFYFFAIVVAYFATTIASHADPRRIAQLQDEIYRIQETERVVNYLQTTGKTIAESPPCSKYWFGAKSEQKAFNETLEYYAEKRAQHKAANERYLKFYKRCFSGEIFGRKILADEGENINSYEEFMAVFRREKADLAKSKPKLTEYQNELVRLQSR